MAKTYYRVNIFGHNGVSKSHHVYDDAETALRKAASERTDHNSAVVWEIKGSRHVCLVNYDGLDRIEAAAYIVYVGERGNEQGHYAGASDTLTGAKQIAGRELSDYAGDGWGKITNDKTGERYSREGNASWVGPF